MKTRAEKVKCAIYARQSSGNDEDSPSVEAQISRCESFARGRGWEVVGVYKDLNTSGRLYPTGAENNAACDEALQNWVRTNSSEYGFRPGLGEAIKVFPEISVLLVNDNMRLCRPVMHSSLGEFLGHRLAVSNVKLYSLNDGEFDASRVADNLIRSIETTVNDSQTRLNAEKSKAALAKLREEGYLPNIPKMYGIRYIGGPERKVEVVPEQAEVIRFVFAQILKMRPYNQILRDLNSLYGDRCAGKGFYQSSIYHIAGQPFYAGFVKIYDTPSQGEIEDASPAGCTRRSKAATKAAVRRRQDKSGKFRLVDAVQMKGKEIVSRRDWLKVQEIMAQNRTLPRQRKNCVHPFSGILHCGYCKSRMIVQVDNGKETYLCKRGNDDEAHSECRKARLAIAHIRHSENYTGLKKAVAPLLCLALYKELEDDGLKAMRKKELDDIAIKKEKVARKIESISYDFFNDDSCDKQILEKVIIKGRGILNDLERREQFLKNAITPEEIRQKAEKYYGMVKKLLDGEIDDAQYTLLVRAAIKEIYSYDDHIHVKTAAYGEFDLKRLGRRHYRNFPQYSHEIVLQEKEGENVDLRNCNILITYKYGKGENRVLVVDLGKMSIFFQDPEGKVKLGK